MENFNTANGISVDSFSGNVYVVDVNNHRIQKFDSDGNFITKWGSEGTGDGKLYYPLGISVDSSGNVYVADTSNNSIQVFADDTTETVTNSFPSETKLSDEIVQTYQSINAWGSNGTGDREFRYPVGISVDFTSGNVYVVDSGNNRIQKFDSNGTFHENVGKQRYWRWRNSSILEVSLLIQLR